MDNYTLRCMNSWPVGSKYAGLETFLKEHDIADLGWVDTGFRKKDGQILYIKWFKSKIPCNYEHGCERCHCIKCDRTSK